MGANSWATPGWKHNEQPECLFDDDVNDVYDGIICPDTVQVRRIAFHGYTPGIFAGMEMKIAKYEYSLTSGMDDDEL